MLSVETTPFDPPEGLSGCAFRIGEATVFFAVPAAAAAALSPAAEAILPYAAIMALVHGDDLDLNGMSVDPVLLRNTRSALAETARWHGLRRVPALVGASEAPSDIVPAEGTAVFFSGGIDSHFSVLRFREGGDGDALRDTGPARDAVHIYHTPHPVAPRAFDTLDGLARTAGAFGLDLLPVQTNMMTADPELNDRWADIGHGAGLASVLHLLSGRFGAGVIGSSHTWGTLMPWGSSPVIDPLWSGRRMRIVHDDARYGRVEKTALVARSQAALAGLNVCDIRVEGRGYLNCSRCPKCLRTMVTLDLYGAAGAEAAPAFDWAGYTPAAFARVFLRTESDLSLAREIHDAAAAAGRQDIVAACDVALRRGRRLRPLVRAETLVKGSALGRRYRDRLKAQRTRAYRALGWATKGDPTGK